MHCRKKQGHEKEKLQNADRELLKGCVVNFGNK